MLLVLGVGINGYEAGILPVLGWVVMNTTAPPSLVQVLSEVVKYCGIFVLGGVSELADEHDLGSCAARRGGSNPPFPTIRNSSRTFTP